MSTRYEKFELPVCSETGDPGCMDCVEGQCRGSENPILVTCYRCIECGADNAWGSFENEFPHESTCSQPRARTPESHD